MAGRQAGFFDVDERLQRLSSLGDQLEAYAKTVDFELFRPELETALAYADGAKGGRPPFDPVMMFEILVIQAQNNLSDERAEFLTNDRLSFMRFLGLSLADRVPDATTIWLIPLRLPYPEPQRLRLAADLRSDRGDRCPLRSMLAAMLEHHPHRPRPHLR